MTAGITHDRPAPRALYEWRGNGSTTAQRTPLFDRTTRPRCAHCDAATEKVVGGWWCSFCETAVA
jgi:hypothetical protein